MNRYHSIMETIWLVIGIVTTFIAIYLVYTLGIQETWEFILMPIFAFILFFMRRTYRKQFEKNNFKNN